MRSVNKITLLGYVGTDPEVRSTSSGRRVAQVSLATTRTWKDANDVKQEKTQWHRLVVWNSGTSALADTVEKYVTKGSPLYVEGQVEYRQWQDQQGQTRYSTEINVHQIILLGTKDQPKATGSAKDPPRKFGDDDIPF